MPSRYLLAYIPCKDRTEAQAIADHLLDRRFIACANIVAGVTSLYDWDGKRHTDDEVLLLCKTRRTLARDVEKAITQLHSYDCPCIAWLPVEGFVKLYGKWLNGQIKRKPSSKRV